MHEDISMDGCPKKESQQIVVVCHPHHLLVPGPHKKFQVQEENPHPRVRDFSQHINVPG